MTDEVLLLVGYRRFQDPPNDAKANARNMNNTRYVHPYLA